MQRKIKISILAFILFLASFLRLYRLGSLPSGINSDEVAIAYDAYSILKTGKDQWGEFLPLGYFKSLGDYKLPVHHYLTIPCIALFGLNEFSTRFPSALFGVLTVLLTFFLTKELFKKSAFSYQLSAISTFLLAISPWHIVLSRTGHEVTTSVFFIVLGMWLFFKNNPLLFLSFFLGSYTYHTSRVFTPLILPVLIFLYRDDFKIKRRKAGVYCLLYFLLFLVPFLVGFLSPAGRARVIQTTGIPKVGIINEINEKRGLCLARFLPLPLCRLLYNWPITFAVIYFKNYLNHFSPFTLFTHGIQGFDTFSVPNRGLLYLFELSFVLLGAFFFFKSKNFYKKALIAWLLLYPVPGSLVDFNNSRRMSLVIPVLQIFAALGILKSWHFFSEKKRLANLKAILLTGFGFLITFSFFSFILDALNHDILHSKDFKYGFRGMIEFVKENEDKYENVFITSYYDHPFIYYLFFTQYEPLKFQDESNIERELLKKEFLGGGVRVYRIGKVHFFNAFNWKEVPPNSLFVMDPGRKTDLINIKTESTRRIVKEINDLKDEPVFTIIEVET